MRRTIKIWCCALALCMGLGACAAEQAPQEEPAALPAVSEPAAEEAEEILYETHAAYMSAPRGFFEPDRPLRRAEAAQLLCNLDLAPGEVHTYADVQETAWYFNAVCTAGAYFEISVQEEAAETSEPDADQMSDTAEALAPEPVYFRPEDAALAYELAGALSGALGLSEAALPEGMEPMEVLTRARAAVLMNCLLGRTPDRQALEAVSYDMLLDMPREDASYYDVLEAVLPHEFLAADEEAWNMQTLAVQKPRAGAHTRNGRGFVVDESGCVIREKGLFTYDGWNYLADEANGCIYADGALHPVDGHVVCALRGGQLLQNAARGEYRFDEDGFYTTGSESVDTLLDEAIAACTSQEMTQAEKLRACYDYVRDFKYLGRNAAFDQSVQTPPYEKLLDFAEKILSTGKGDCYNFAASFCLLARRLGFEAECIIGDCGYVWNWHPIAHGWVEITQDGQTLLYDPQIENYNNRAGISNDSCGAYAVRYETAHARYLKH